RRVSTGRTTAARRGPARMIRTRGRFTTRRFACIRRLPSACTGRPRPRACDPKRPSVWCWSSAPWLVSNDGGKTVINATNGIHVDHHAMWIDPVDPDRMIVGDDGGVSISFDQGGTYMFANMFAVGQLYNISYDFEVPYRVCGGLQ